MFKSNSEMYLCDLENTGLFNDFFALRTLEIGKLGEMDSRILSPYELTVWPTVFLLE